MGFFGDIKRNSHKPSVSNWIRNERNLGKKPKTMNKNKMTLDKLYMGKKKKPKKKPIGIKKFSFA